MANANTLTRARTHTNAYTQTTYTHARAQQAGVNGSAGGARGPLTNPFVPIGMAPVQIGMCAYLCPCACGCGNDSAFALADYCSSIEESPRDGIDLPLEC